MNGDAPMSTQAKSSAPRRYRSLFLSDFHLGARGCQPAPILNFLREAEADTIYLVGDILDIWHGGRIHWSATHDAIIRELDKRAETGTRVIYLPGNHDAPMRALDRNFMHFELAETVVHEAADGQRYLVLHGDQCDGRILRWHFMTRLGSRMDALFRGLDGWLLRRRGRHESEGSAIQWAIARFNDLMAHGKGFERRLMAMATQARAQGVICGHSHKPTLRDLHGLTYANCGDWVDSLTALAENHDGALQLLQWVNTQTVPVADPLTEPAEAKVRTWLS